MSEGIFSFDHPFPPKSYNDDGDDSNVDDSQQNRNLFFPNNDAYQSTENQTDRFEKKEDGGTKKGKKFGKPVPTLKTGLLNQHNCSMNNVVERPYLNKKQQKPGWYSKNETYGTGRAHTSIGVASNAFYFALPWILLSVFYCFICILIIHFVLVPHFPKYFGGEEEREGDFLPNLLEYAFIAITIFLGFRAAGTQSKYAAGIRSFYEIIDYTVSTSIYILKFIKKDTVDEIRRVSYYSQSLNTSIIPETSHQNVIQGGRKMRALMESTKTQSLITSSNVKFRTLQGIEVMEEMQHLFRSMLYAMKHNFRTNTSVLRGYDSTALELGLLSGPVQIELLPLPEHLKEQLRPYTEELLAGILSLIGERFQILLDMNVLRREAIYTWSVYISVITQQITALSSLASLGIAPVYDNILLVAISLFVLVAPFELWIHTHMGIWILLIHALLSTIVFSIYVATRKFGNPFDKPDCSPFSYYPISNIVHRSAKVIDKLFDLNILESCVVIWDAHGQTPPTIPFIVAPGGSEISCWGSIKQSSIYRSKMSSQPHFDLTETGASSMSHVEMSDYLPQPFPSGIEQSELSQRNVRSTSSSTGAGGGH
jgi:hypothetical protein